jgi:hypothetical protein
MHRVAGGPKKLALQATPDHVLVQRATTGATVTIACKLPNGLNLGHIHGDEKPHVILRGSNHPLAIGGYGLTHGISKDAWEKWKTQHAFLPALQNGLIFEHDKPGSARSMAAEMAEVQSGLEPLNGDNPAADERTRGEVDDGIEATPTDEQKRVNEKAKAKREELLEEVRVTEGDE